MLIFKTVDWSGRCETPAGKARTPTNNLLWAAPKHLASPNMLVDAGATAEDPRSELCERRRLKRNVIKICNQYLTIITS
jgi:hypothetical protein